METKLLTPSEVAEILKVSKAKAYSLLKNGEIPTVRIGTLVRVRQQDLERYVNEKLSQDDGQKSTHQDLH
jgi:excisionase family DNA binding protein